MIATVVLIARERTRAAQRVLVATTCAFLLLSTTPVAYLLAWSLEHPYATVPDVHAFHPSIIVVLAGGAGEREGYRPIAELGGESWRRLWRAVEVYRGLDGGVPILYSGGSGDPFHPVSHEAALAKEYAITMGVPSEHFSIESESRTTYESGLAIRSLLDQWDPQAVAHRVLLVTSARHMRRSLAVLSYQGIVAIPIAADFSFGAMRWNILGFLPSASAFGSSVASIHEWVGIGVYALFGRT